MASTWIHLHLPRLQAGVADVISVKVPGQRIDYASWVSLRDARLVVNEVGRRRCVREGVRNVHAWVVGQELTRATGTHPHGTPVGFRKALYDPFKGTQFVDSETLEPLTGIYSSVIMSGKNVYYAR